MEENETNETKNPHEVRDQFAKLMIGVAVGFIATKLVENAYDGFVQSRREDTAAEDQQ